MGILFNAMEPAGNSINAIDLTLKFYASDGTFLGAMDGQQAEFRCQQSGERRGRD